MNMIDLAPFHPDTFSVEGEAGSTREFLLSTEFQPIFSLAHRRAVGYEGLIRAADALGRTYAPGELLSQAPAGVARMQLDRQCRRIHIKNFQRLGDPNSWLFLNVDPYVAARGKGFGPFAKLLEEFRLPAHRVAVELVETPFEDEKRLAAAFEHYRTLGCLTVIDDFGAGFSNFDRIWRLKPDIVKIDREMTHRVAVEPLARRMFAGIISVLHEAGALVCVEGIETEAEALCATDANADMMQGNYFARPAARAVREGICDDLFARLFAGFRSESAEFQERRTVRLEPYVAALADAVLALSSGADRLRAVKALLDLECTERCYLVAADGSQIGASAETRHRITSRDRRLKPVRPITGTNWQTKPFFRRAIEEPGKVQITRPYLSPAGPKLCVTLSYALTLNGSYHVLCADLDFAALAGEGLAFRLAEGRL